MSRTILNFDPIIGIFKWVLCKRPVRCMRPNSRCSGVPRTSITTIFGGILKIQLFPLFFWHFGHPYLDTLAPLYLIMTLLILCSVCQYTLDTLPLSYLNCDPPVYVLIGVWWLPSCLDLCSCFISTGRSESWYVLFILVAFFGNYFVV